MVEWGFESRENDPVTWSYLMSAALVTTITTSTITVIYHACCYPLTPPLAQDPLWVEMVPTPGLGLAVGPQHERGHWLTVL